MDYNLNIRRGPPENDNGWAGAALGGVIAGVGHLLFGNDDGESQHHYGDLPVAPSRDNYVPVATQTWRVANRPAPPPPRSLTPAERRRSELCRRIDRNTNRVHSLDRHPYNIVYPCEEVHRDFSRKLYDRVEKDLHTIIGEDSVLGQVRRRKPFTPQDFVWRGPDGPNPNAAISYGDINWTDGTTEPLFPDKNGQWTFNKVHDTARDACDREAYAHYFESVARLYAVDDNFLYRMVAEEVAHLWPEKAHEETRRYNSECGQRLRCDVERFWWKGLSRLNIKRSSLPNWQGEYLTEQTVLSTPNISMAHLVQWAANRITQELDADITQEDLIARSKRIILQGRRAVLGVLTRDLSKKISGTPADVLSRHMQRATIKLAQASDEMAFSLEQERFVREACGREERHNFLRCRDSIAEEQDELNIDTIVSSVASSAVTRGSMVGPVVNGVNWLHKSVRLRTRNPVCRQAYEDYINKACENRVLPKKIVKVDIYPNTKETPNEKN